MDIVKNAAQRIVSNPAVLVGLLASIIAATEGVDDWTAWLPLAAGVIIRFLVTPAHDYRG